MPRETISSVKKAATLKLRQQSNAFALKLDVKARDHQEQIKVRDDHIHSLLRRTAEAVSAVSAADQEHRVQLIERDERIAELLKANNDYLQEAREARASNVRLQGNLSDAARIIATLGQRPEV